MKRKSHPHSDTSSESSEHADADAGAEHPARALPEVTEVTETEEISALDPSRMLAIEVQDEQGVRSFPLLEGSLHVGSSRGADIRVHDELVSRRHCELRLHDGRLELRDLNSKNGSFLGGARVRDAQLGLGSVLLLGGSTLTVRRFSEHEDAAELDAVETLPGVAGNSVRMRRVALEVRKLARLAAPVLVRGETGTGKELVAHLLHRLGPRESRPFVPVNVANLPRDLVESELFGHERGAFTGAVARRRGAFAEAEEGTLFLDEIGELPADAQPKLLRALDGYEVRRVGGERAQRPAARVVAATHVPLETRVEAGFFRRDLFHRLEVCVVRLPALRERAQDIPAIAKAMLASMCADLGSRRLSSAATARLLQHDWPGNARELRNVLYRAAVLANDAMVLDVAHVERALCAAPSREHRQITPKLAKALLRSHSGNLSAAARSAGLPRTSFRKQLVKAG